MRTTKRLLKKIEKATSVYMVGFWAKWSVREYKWTGKWYYEKDTGAPIPIVWYYWDDNGTCNEWIKVRLDLAECVFMYDWTFRKGVAQKVAQMLNKEEKESENKEREIKLDFSSKKESRLPTTGSCAVPPKITIVVKNEKE